MYFKALFLLQIIIPYLASAEVRSKPRITRDLQPKYGSVKGETLIRITGVRFSPDRFSQNEPNKGNRVVFYNERTQFECDVQIDDTSITQIMCRTPNNIDDDSWFTVKVQSDGVWSDPKKYAFQPKYMKTPYVHSLWPRVVEPQSVISQTGNQFTRSYNSTNINWQTGKSCKNCAITKAWSGGRICDLYNRTNFPMEIYNLWMERDINPTTNQPIPGTEGKNSFFGGFDCRLTGTTVGYQNFTYIIDQDFGRSRTRKEIKRISPDNQIYDLQTVAVVNKLSTSTTGINGGGRLKIQGRWFSPVSLDNKIFIGEKECLDVKINQDGTELSCTPQISDLTDNSKIYEGNRGFFSFIYEGLSYQFEDMHNGRALDNMPNRHDNDDKSYLIKQSYQDGTLSTDQTKGINQFKSYTRAFFKPRIDSEYKFSSTMDDKGSIYLSSSPKPNSNKPDLKLIHSQNFKREGSPSEPIFLKSNNSYPIEFLLHDNGGAGYFSPIIYQRDTLLSHKDFVFANDHKQSLSVGVKQGNEVQRIKFNNLPLDIDLWMQRVWVDNT